MNSNNPKITTNICTYRRPQMLRRAIESILNQTYQDFCICIYDNASEDDTPAVVAEFIKRDPRISYHCHSENIGLLANYSYAMKQVSTPFFSFLADDDLILPDFYRVALAGFDREPTAFFSSTSFLSLSLLGKKIGHAKFPSKVFYAPEGVFEFVESGVNPHLHCTLIRQEVVSEFNGFVHIWDDIDLLYRIAAAHPIILCSEDCLLSITHNVDKGRKVTIDHAWLEQETIAASLHPLLSDDAYHRLENLFDKKTKSAIYFLAIELIYDHDFAGAKLGADRLRNKYGMYWPALVLEILVSVFRRFPALLSFLKSVRYLKPMVKNQREKFPFLSYSEFMDIYQNKKY